MKKAVLWLVTALLALSAVLAGCKKPDVNPTEAPETKASVESSENPETEGTEKAHEIKATYKTTFSDGTTKEHELVSTTEGASVGDVLLAAGLVTGETSEYGLYVTAVEGEVLDWATTGLWWGFFVDGEMASVGVDQVTFEEGHVYEFRATK